MLSGRSVDKRSPAAGFGAFIIDSVTKTVPCPDAAHFVFTRHTKPAGKLPEDGRIGVHPGGSKWGTARLMKSCLGGLKCVQDAFG